MLCVSNENHTIRLSIPLSVAVLQDGGLRNQVPLGAL